MDTITRKKSTGEPGNGGEFGSNQRTDAEEGLLDASVAAAATLTPSALVEAAQAAQELHESTEQEWTGSETALIESETNPWLRDANGNSIDLTNLTLDATLKNGCGECGPYPGVISAMDTEYGIQRCDTCELFDGDFSAAKALADALGQGATVWFHGTN